MTRLATRNRILHQKRVALYDSHVTFRLKPQFVGTPSGHVIATDPPRCGDVIHTFITCILSLRAVFVLLPSQCLMNGYFSIRKNHVYLQRISLKPRVNTVRIFTFRNQENTACCRTYGVRQTASRKL